MSLLWYLWRIQWLSLSAMSQLLVGTILSWQMSSKDSTADEGLKKIRSKSWVEPLGQCLEVTGTIFEIAGECGVPIVGLVGQVLGVGANLLREAFICQIHIKI